MDIGTVFTQVWNSNPIWSAGAPATQPTGTSQSGTGPTGGFGHTLQSLTAELQQFEAGMQAGATGNTQETNSSQPTEADAQEQTAQNAANGSDFGDQLGRLAGGLTGDAMLALQLYAGGPAALLA